MDVNQSGVARARALISAGKVDRTSSWSFSAEDGNALLGASGNDWTAYAQAHLGEDKSASPKTKARFHYPVIKSGLVYRSGLIAAKQRASAEGESAIEAAASELLDKVDAGKPKSMDGGVELKSTIFEYKFLDTDGAPAGAFEGYGSVFNNEDDNGDVMMPGAFDKTLAQHKALGRMPKMLLNHGGLANFFGPSSTDDMLPIGKWSDLSPDSNGLHGKGQLINLDTDRGKSIYGAMKEGELSDMSIAYTPRDSVRGQKANEPRRQLKSVDLLEMGPVTFPANRLATINDVKGLAFLRSYDMRDLEGVLRDGGLSRSDAVKAIAAFKNFFQRDAGSPDPSNREEPRDAATSEDLQALAARIRAASR